MADEARTGQMLCQAGQQEGHADTGRGARARAGGCAGGCRATSVSQPCETQPAPKPKSNRSTGSVHV